MEWTISWIETDSTTTVTVFHLRWIITVIYRKCAILWGFDFMNITESSFILSSKHPEILKSDQSTVTKNKYLQHWKEVPIINI